MSSVAPLKPAKPGLPQWCYPANVVTELRILAVPAIVVAVLFRHFGWALLLFVAAAVSDGFDGWLARRYRQHSSLGAYLDPLADKSLLTTLFVTLAIVGVLPWALTILVFVRDGCILVSALVLFTLTDFRDFRPTWWGKASTTAELATVSVALLEALVRNQVVLGIEMFGWFAVTFFSLISGIHYAFTSARRFHAQRA